MPRRIRAVIFSNLAARDATQVNPPAVLPPAPDRPYAFVCYAHDDWKLVNEQIEWLRAQGFEIWFDRAIEAGNRWSEDLARAVEGCAAVLCFLSPRSARSRYCLDEIHFALECGKPIVPAEIEPVTLTPGLRLSLGSTHRIFMYTMDPDDFREKLASGLRAAMDGTPALDLHGAVAPEAQVAAPAEAVAGFSWRPVAVGVALAVVAFALIYLRN
jgi:hypothetical protein